MTILADYVKRDFRNMLVRALELTNEYKRIAISPNGHYIIVETYDDETLRISVRVTVVKEKDNVNDNG